MSQVGDYDPWFVVTPLPIALIKSTTIYITWEFYQATDLSFKEIAEHWLGRKRQYEGHKILRRPVGPRDRRRFTMRLTYSVPEEVTT